MDAQFCIKGNVDVIRLLLLKKADINTENKRGQSASRSAILLCNEEAKLVFESHQLQDIQQYSSNITSVTTKKYTDK